MRRMLDWPPVFLLRRVAVALGLLVLTRYLEGRLERARQERLERRWSEGRTHGRAEAHREWRDWNARRLEAAGRNEDFLEPPPS